MTSELALGRESRPAVGIIANPMAGRDIRRLVAQGRFVPNHEKVNILARVLAGLEASGVERVLMMPDFAGLGRGAASRFPNLDVHLLRMPVFNDDYDSTRAARTMAEMGAGCIVTLGGDGTNRAVAKGSGDVPLLPLSTGTNNAFPSDVEGTVAGLAAGVVALGLVETDRATRRARFLEVQAGEAERDIALVDVAVSTERFVGARAIWDTATLHEIFLAGARPDAIGLSAIGARLSPEPSSLRISIGGGGTTVLAPIAPGMVTEVAVRDWSRLEVDEPVSIDFSPCTIALDGERTIAMAKGQRASVVVRENGPPVVDAGAAMKAATAAGVFGGG